MKTDLPSKRRKTAFQAGVALLILFFSGLSAGCGAKKELPNIVLISIDSLREDHVGCYGYERNTTPVLDRLAGEGAFFSRAYSSTTWTLPAHIALLTSLPDGVHQVISENDRLSDARTTLAESLRDKGYHTAAIVSGPYLNRDFGFGQGFDHFYDATSYPFPTETMFGKGIASVNDFLSLEKEKKKSNTQSHRDITSPAVNREALKWLAGAKEPFFLFLHYFDVHYDFLPPEPYDTMFDSTYEGSFDGRNFLFDPRINPRMNRRDLEHIIALYDGEIAWTDEHIGEVMDVLRARKETRKTLTVILSDHGDEFFEHGQKGHRKTLYDEVLRIPLIFHCPGILGRPGPLSRRARIIDVAPTILDMIGLPPLENGMGSSLYPAMKGEETSPQPPIFAELRRRLFAIQEGKWKLIVNLQKESRELYDVSADPAEQRPLERIPPGEPCSAESLKKTLFEMLEKNRKIAERFNALHPHQKVSIREEVLEKLKKLGYLK